MPHILVVGSVNCDMVLRMPVMPSEGENRIVSDLAYLPGGKGANQAVACQALGARVRFCGKVGSDENGRKLRDALAQHKVDTSGISVEESVPTGIAVIAVEEKGQNRIMVYPGANMRLTPEEVLRYLDNSVDAMLLQFEVPADTVIACCAKAAQLGIPVIVDAGPAQQFPIERLAGVTIFSPNETEAAALCGIIPDTLEHAKDAAKALQKRVNAPYIVLKLGSRGAFCLGPEGFLSIVPPKVAVVDPTAAGDAFTAAMTIRYFQTHDIRDAIVYGNLARAYAVTRLGAMPSLPTKGQLELFQKSLRHM